MLSAISLAKAGIECLVVEKRLSRLSAPKAHAVNARTLEICERLGVSADEIRRAGASVADGGQVHFVDTLSGAHFGSLPYERQDDGVRAFTPWPLVNIPQPKFEDFLSRTLEDQTDAALMRGFAVESLTQNDDLVQTTLSQTDSGELMRIQSDYVIAADGANSTIRDLLDIGLTGPEGLAHNMMIHFDADLTELTKQHPGLLYFCLSPEASGAFIGYDRKCNWVFMQAYDPSTQTRQDFDDETCVKLVEAAAGQPLPNIEILNVSPWTMCAEVADNYKKGRVFLCGDAAHRFPPTGGLGLNTGAADAQNLTWKLARVLQEKASQDLLDTYEQERRPVAQINCEQSLMNSAKIFQVFEAVYGADAESIGEHYANACELPSQPDIQAAIEAQRPHFDSLNLQLGYRYGSSPEADLNISCYTPSFLEGDFLPRIELVDQPWLLGLLPIDEYSLVAGPDGQSWQQSGLTTLVEAQDFSPIESFWGRAGLGRSGALLIRPDGHIAARWEDAVPCPATAVGEVLGGTPIPAVMEVN